MCARALTAESCVAQCAQDVLTCKGFCLICHICPDVILSPSRGEKARGCNPEGRGVENGRGEGEKGRKTAGERLREGVEEETRRIDVEGLEGGGGEDE